MNRDRHTDLAQPLGGGRLSARLRLRRASIDTAVVLVAAVVASTCGGGSKSSNSPNAPSGSPSQLARTYLDEVMGLMQANSINRQKIDWAAFRASVIAAAGSAQSIADTLPAIQTALQLLGDGHSRYQSATGVILSVSRTCTSGALGRVASLPADIGYLKVGAFIGDSGEANAYANNLRGAIASTDRDGLVGWVVDLRANFGGNMWPMLAGVVPILGQGQVGYFVGPTGVENVWESRDNGAYLDGQLQQRITPYNLRRSAPRVAVLVDGGTGSSGEAIVIAFRGRPDTRLFGAPTCGISTANFGYQLSDNAVLGLTISTMADRAKTPYGREVIPDEQVTGTTEVEDRAVAWVRTGQ